VTEGGLLALDAKVILDDKASYRHADLYATLVREHTELDPVRGTVAEKLARERGATFVLLDGDVGVIADGAGTGMLALDLIQDAGGRPANFCELGGLASPEVMCQAIEVVVANPKVRALLITLIGDLTRMDEMAEGIVQYAESNGLGIPAVIRMAGTQEEAGKAILGAAGLETFDDLPAAVEAVVELAWAGA
jgi:succinyl-CoA synthetase beta subunit